MLDVQEIELEMLKPWKDNLRLNEHAVDAVAQSIRSLGLRRRIIVEEP